MISGESDPSFQVPVAEGRHVGRWQLGPLIWRWISVLWLSPLLGLIVGLVLVFGFRRANVVNVYDLYIGPVPQSVDANDFLEEVKSQFASDHMFLKLRKQLDIEKNFFRTPIWWLKTRIDLAELEYLNQQNNAVILRLTHPTSDGCSSLSEAFGEAAKDILLELRASHEKRWLPEIDARLKELQDQLQAAKAQNKEDDFSYHEELFALEMDRDMLIQDDSDLMVLQTFPGSYYSPPWWKSPPQSMILIAMCCGYGLMAFFPSIFILEYLFPRKKMRRP